MAVVKRSILKAWVPCFSSNPQDGSVDQLEAAAITDAERIRQLERDNARLREERDLLRRTTKYFAEETTWGAASSSLTKPAPTTWSSGCVRS